MERRFGVVGKVWCLDRGMADRENLAWLNETRRPYILGTPKSELNNFSQRPTFGDTSAAQR